MQFFGTRNGSYLQTAFLWWIWGSWIHLLVVRLYELLRIAIWIVARIIEFIVVAWGVFVLALIWSFNITVSLTNTIIAGLLGQWGIDLAIVFPFIFLFLFWLLWLAFPLVSCLIQDEIYEGIVVTARDLVISVFRIGILIANIIIRMFNQFVPILGLILYIVMDMATTFGRTLVQLLGALPLFDVFAAWISLVIEIVELFFGIIEAIVSTSPGLLKTIAITIGPVVTAYMDLGAISLRVTVWLLFTLFFALEPLLKILVQYFNMIKKHYFGRRVARSLMTVAKHFGVGSLRVPKRRYFGRGNMRSLMTAAKNFGVGSLGVQGAMQAGAPDAPDARASGILGASLDGVAHTSAQATASAPPPPTTPPPTTPPPTTSTAAPFSHRPPASQRDDSLDGTDTWATVGESVSQYWSEDSLQRASSHVAHINDYNMRQPAAGSLTHYYVLRGGNPFPGDPQANEILLALERQEREDEGGEGDVRAPMSTHDRAYAHAHAHAHARAQRDVSSGRGTTPIYTPSDHRFWQQQQQPQQQQQHDPSIGGVGARHNGLPYATAAAPSDSRASGAAAHDAYSAHTYAMEPQLERLHTKVHARLDEDASFARELHMRTRCHSRHCGGKGASLPHPIVGLRRAYKRDDPRADWTGLDTEDLHAHRRRVIHVSAALHATRITARHVFREHLTPGRLGEHIGRAWHGLSGHATVTDWFEAETTRADSPVDSMLAPRFAVLAEIAPFRWITETRRALGADASTMGDWLRERHVFHREVRDPITGHAARVLHVTTRTRDEIVARAGAAGRDRTPEFDAMKRRLLGYRDAPEHEMSVSAQDSDTEGAPSWPAWWRAQIERARTVRAAPDTDVWDLLLNQVRATNVARPRPRRRQPKNRAAEHEHEQEQEQEQCASSAVAAEQNATRFGDGGGGARRAAEPGRAHARTRRDQMMPAPGQPVRAQVSVITSTDPDPDADFPPDEEPALPVFKLLTTTDCVDKPKNPLCLPEIPQQIACLVENLAKTFIQDELPVQVCDSEQFCSKFFFIHDRPAVLTPANIIIFTNLEYIFSFQRIANGFAWIGVALAAWGTFALRMYIATFTAVFPFLKPILLPVLEFFPEIITAQDLVCLVPFFYDLALLFVLTFLFFVLYWPFVRFFIGLLAQGAALVQTMRAIEEARRGTIESSTEYLYYHLAFDSQLNPGVRLKNDPFYMRRNSLGIVPWHNNPGALQDPLMRVTYNQRWRQAERLERPPTGATGDILARGVEPSVWEYQMAARPAQRDQDGTYTAPHFDNANERLYPSARMGAERADADGTGGGTSTSTSSSSSSSSSSRGGGGGGGECSNEANNNNNNNNGADRAHPFAQLSADEHALLLAYMGMLETNIEMFGFPLQHMTYPQLHMFELRFSHFLGSVHTTREWQRRACNMLHARREHDGAMNASALPHIRAITFNPDRALGVLTATERAARQRREYDASLRDG